MTKKKQKWLIVSDYLINLVLSLFGLLVFSYIMKFSWGYIVYSVFFCLSLFAFLYSRLYTSAKIDLRTNEARLINAIKMVLPLLIGIFALILLYSLFYYNIIPADDVILKSVVNSETNEVSTLTLLDCIKLFARVCFFNLTGFMAGRDTLPYILLINPVVIIISAFVGYWCGMKKIYLSDNISALIDKIKNKFDE